MRAFFVFLVLVVAGVVTVGFYRDWFHLSVDKDKITADTHTATDAVEGAGTRIKDRLGGTTKDGADNAKAPSSAQKTVTGVVKSVDPSAKRFTMTTKDNTELTIDTDAASQLRHNDDDLSWERLRPRDTVSVDFEVRDGKNMAIRVTVTEQFAAAQ